MAGTALYKNTAGNVHRARYMTTEDNFSAGMKFTDNPLPPGNAKVIANYNLKNDGECLIPRGGLTQLDEFTCDLSSLFDSQELPGLTVHHTGMLFVNNYTETDAVLCPYALLCTSSELYPQSYNTHSSILVIEYEGEYLVSKYGYNLHDIAGDYTMYEAPDEMHGLTVTGTNRKGIHASLEANTYVMLTPLWEDPIRALCRIKAIFDEDFKSFKWYLERVEAREVQPAQAINYGYNMLKMEPYEFITQASSTGAVELTGVVPYDSEDNLLLTARAGTTITFKLSYKYSTKDISEGDRYLVQWELQDLNNSTPAEVVQKVRNSMEYSPGEEIAFTCTPSYTAFSVIVRLYKKSEIELQDAAWEKDTALQALITKDENLTPNQVTTLASYYLTSNNKSSTLNVSPVAYHLGTATGMCTWAQRLVLWGVKNAKSTLFVSEINDPSYIPYPNNSEIFTEDIVCAVPYMNDLLVFTKTALYRLELNEDGLSYKTTCVQERLNMTASDAGTIVTVQNMVYFKSGNYFYMIVPNASSTNSPIQMAPVSRPIEHMLDNMYDTLAGILDDVYNITYDEYTHDIDFQLADYHVYLDNTQLRNVYKLKINLKRGEYDTDIVYIDVCLNYDTVLRAWTIYTYQSNAYRDVVYKASVTKPTTFVHLYDLERHSRLTFSYFNKEIPKDSLTLGDQIVRKYGNYQLINTGYRMFEEDYKKRFREVQFVVNVANSKQLKFHTAFIVDNVETVQMYEPTVVHCTDPNDPNYGTIFVERVLLTPVSTPSLTTLDTWELDASVFPDITVHKVRYKVSGKGYGGSVKILSLNETPFELLHINWVYRVMFAR